VQGLPKALVLLGGDIVFPQPALTLVDSIGRSWEVQWYASGRHRLALVPKDWALFAVHHFLEEGDACVFEATDIQALTILVRIFRVVDIPDNLGTDIIYTHYSVEPVT
jgi:glyoxylase-like metal-dependent hydrolase (beta-lactamase superfamily II)